MNIKPILAAAALLCLSFTSFSQPKTKMTPLEYNDYLSSITDSLYSKGTKWGTKFAETKKGDQNFSKLKSLRKDISTFLILKKEEVKKFAAVGKGGEDLKRAMLNFMDYELDMVEIGFMPVENLTSSSTDKEIDAAMDNLISQSGKEGDVLKMVRAAQMAFAKENGFTLEEAEK
jgi:hypothetical protein